MIENRTKVCRARLVGKETPGLEPISLRLRLCMFENNQSQVPFLVLPRYAYSELIDGPSFMHGEGGGYDVQARKCTGKR
jgi:hypothetical protein